MHGPPAGPLLVQGEPPGAPLVPAEAVRNDFNQSDLGRRDVGDLAFRLAEVVAGPHAMPQAVLVLHQAVHRPAEAQRADHLQRVERELLEELAVALGDGTYAAIARTGTRGARQERRAQLGRRVQEGLVGLDLRQRLDPPARLLLRVLDETRLLVVRARARPERGGADARQGHPPQGETGVVWNLTHE